MNPNPSNLPTQEEFLKNLKKVIPAQRHVIVKKGEGRVVDAVSSSDKIRGESVCWGFPMDEILFSLWFSNLINVGVYPWDDVICIQSTYLPEARNFIHKNFVENMESNWLIMLDSDVLPPPQFVERLLSHNKPMVGGWYRKKGGTCPPVVYRYKGVNPIDNHHNWEEYTEPGKGLERVDGAGAGCWLMHRRVAQALGAKPYDMVRGGEDLQLCRKVTEAGFEMFVDWDVRCAHAGVGMT